VRGLLLQRHTLAAGVTVDTRLCYVAPCSDDGFAAVTSLPLRRAADLVPTSYRRDQASTNPVQQRPITRAAPHPRRSTIRCFCYTTSQRTPGTLEPLQPSSELAKTPASSIWPGDALKCFLLTHRRSPNRLLRFVRIYSLQVSSKFK